MGGRYISSLFRVDVPVPDDSDIFAKWQREWRKFLMEVGKDEMLKVVLRIADCDICDNCDK